MAEELELEGQGTGSIEWKKYLSLARRHAWQVVIPFFAVWVLVWGVSWIIPPTYRSGTLILVEQPSLSKELVQSNVATDMQKRLDSIHEQVMSRTNLQRVIDDLNLYPGLRGRKTMDEVIEHMQKDVSVEVVRSPEGEQLTAFNIFFSYDKPDVARQVVSELADRLINQNVESRIASVTNATSFLESQLEEKRQRLADQEERVRKFKDAHPGELPTQVQSNLQILSGYQSQLSQEQDALGRAKQQNAYYESLVSQYKTVGHAGRPGDPTMGLPAINQELDRLKAQLTDLLSRYTEQHPDVRKVKQQIAQTEKMRQQLISDLKSKPSDASDVDDPAYGKDMPLMEVQSQLKANQIEIANRQRAIADLQNKITEYQSRLNRTPFIEQELADLNRDYETSRLDYESLLTKKNQAELSTNVEKRQEGEHFRVLDPASLPTKPFSPNRFKLSLIGLVAGLVVGIGIAAGTELMDDRVFDEKEFMKLVPAEVLVEIPPLPTAHEEQEHRKRLVRALAVVAVMVICIAIGTAYNFAHS